MNRPPWGTVPAHRRGYFGIAAWHTKNSHNVGTLWRSAHVFGAAFIATVGRRYKHHPGDTLVTPRHVPLYHFTDLSDLWDHIPYDCVPVAVERTDDAYPLTVFSHPRSALYLLGPEDGSLSEELLVKCRPRVVALPGNYPLNVAVAGSIVMYDRVTRTNPGP